MKMIVIIKYQLWIIPLFNLYAAKVLRSSILKVKNIEASRSLKILSQFIFTSKKGYGISNFPRFIVIAPDKAKNVIIYQVTVVLCSKVTNLHSELKT